MSRLLTKNLKVINLIRPKSRYTTFVLCENLGDRHVKTLYRSVSTASKISTSQSTVNKLDNKDEDFEILSSKVEKLLHDADWNVRRTGRTYQKNVEIIFNGIRDLGSPTSTQCLYLLRSCAIMFDVKPSDRVQFASDVWDVLQKLGVKFDVHHFNSLLRMYLDSPHPFSPSEFLVLMESYGVQPNKITYMYVIEGYCNDGNLQNASEVLEIWKEKGYAINEAVFCSLIKGHMKNNDSSGAENLIKTMKASGMEPTAEPYTALACGYAEVGDASGLNSSLHLAKHDNVIISSPNYLKIIKSLAINQHHNLVDEILQGIVDEKMYHHDYINAVFDLVNADCEDVAFKLLLKSYNPENNNSTNLFIKQLIKANKPIEKIIQFCHEIHTRGLNDIILLNAAKVSVDFKNIDYSLSFFEEMHKMGQTVRIHHFWSLLSDCGNILEDQVWRIIRTMVKLGIPVDFNTYVNNVFPHLSLSNPEKLLKNIQESGESITGAVDPLFHIYCNSNKIENAYKLIEKYPIHLQSSFEIKNILSMYKSYEKYPNKYLKVLEYIIDNIGQYNSDSEVIRGQTIATLIQTNQNLFELFVRHIKSNKYSNECLDTCYQILKSSSPHLLGHFRALVNKASPMVAMEETEENKQILLLKGNKPALQKFLVVNISHHIYNKNLRKACELNMKLKELKGELPPPLHAQLLRLLCEENHLEEAEAQFAYMKSRFPGFILDLIKIFDYVTLLIKFSKLKMAEKVLKEEFQVLNLKTNHEILLKSLKRLLNAAVETGSSSFVKMIHDCLIIHSKELQSVKLLFEPLIKVQVYGGDLESAIEEFVKCVNNHQLMPCLGLLLKKCIALDDARKLETVMDAAAKCSGQNAVLIELSLAFIENNRFDKALKVYQNSGNKIDISSFQNICSRLHRQNKLHELDQLLRIVIPLLESPKKDDLLIMLFQSYGNKDFKKASETLKFLQSNGYVPSQKVKDSILQTQSSLLSSGESSSLHLFDENVSSIEKEFVKYTSSGEIHKVFEVLERMRKGDIKTIPLNEVTKFVDLVVQKRCISDLSSNVQMMSYIIENSVTVLNPIFAKCSDSGFVDMLKVFPAFLPDFTLRKLNFNNYLSRAYINSHKEEELLTELENRVETKNKLFSAHAIEHLIKQPNLADRVMKLVDRYAEQNFFYPLAIIWAHHFIHGDYESAERMLQTRTVPIEKASSMILRSVQETENIKQAKDFIKNLNEANVDQRFQEKAYGTLLEILVKKRMVEEATELMCEAQEKHLQLDKHYQSTLINLRHLIEKQG